MVASDRDENFDELDQFVAQESLTDPVFAAAHVDAGERSRLLREMVSCRKQSKRSQTAVAKLMGTTQSAVSEIEGGASDPRLSTLQRYVRAIGCTLYFEIVSDDGRRLYATPRPWLATTFVGFDVSLPSEPLKNLGVFWDLPSLMEGVLAPAWESTEPSPALFGGSPVNADLLSHALAS